MANISKIKLNGTTYDLEDTTARTDIGDVDDLQTTAKDNLVEAVNECFQSASNGKTAIANAITGAGVSTSASATFATMATNIGTVATNKYNAGVTDADGRANTSSTNYKTGYNAGVSATKVGTATASQVLTGYTFTNSSSVGASGSMANNGAVSQSLAINGSYTIPAGYHNGSGKVTQSITTKAAATYTPGDSAQTIASGQYLSGVQTISAVPTETKSVTAGTSATTVSRTSGKYMTSVTVNPTPSQTKSVTMTSSPLTVTPDSGKLLSSVTISANLGRSYASGSVVITKGTEWYQEYLYSEDNEYTGSRQINYIVLPISFTPSVVRLVFTDSTGWKYQAFVNSVTTVMSYGVCYPTGNAYSSIDSGYYRANDRAQLVMSGLKIMLPGYYLLADFTSADYEAWG